MDFISNENFDNNLENVASFVESDSKYSNECSKREISLSVDASSESSFEKTARRPVEPWKYVPLTANKDLNSYKCSICCSVYQHKKSLNKHWKDKHHMSTPSRLSSQPLQERILSNINENQLIVSPSTNNIIGPNINYIPDPRAENRDVFYPPITSVNPSQIINRKRMSLEISEYDENNKENYSNQQPKRMSLMPIQSLLLQKNRNMYNVNEMVASSSSMQRKSAEEMLDFHPTDNGPLDLRISTINLRCFQCVFHTNNIVELNEHFKHLHISILFGAKSFCLPMSLYQKMLLNQFTAIVRTESESFQNFNGPMKCYLCDSQLQTRHEMIQHLGFSHGTEMIWVCFVCGYGCRLPAQLSYHFRCHSDIKMLTRSVTLAEPLSDCSIPKPEDHLATSTPQNSGAKSKRIFSKKEPSLSDSSTTKEKPLKCLVCDISSRWRSELFTHMITHSDHRPFGCKFCSYRSKWKWDVPKHLKRCRMAPSAVRKSDVQNAYLITLLQYHSPPPGDILYEFMKEYNIKDIGSLSKPINCKPENEDISKSEEICTSADSINKPDASHSKNQNLTTGHEYEAISNASEESDYLDVGTDSLFVNGTDKSDRSIKAAFKKCPWCQEFLTNKPSEMSAHLVELHTDHDSCVN